MTPRLAKLSWLCTPKSYLLSQDAAEVIQEKFIAPAGEEQAYSFSVIAFGPSQ